MKGNKLILLVASILLLTISSGLLFYKNLFLLEGPTGSGGKVDFEELRYADLQVNTTALMMRKSLSVDQTVIQKEINRIKELLNIVTDVNKSTTELSTSLKKLQEYFDKKIKGLHTFQESLKELKTAVDSLNPAYNELNKNNIKFSVDKRDFYKECVVDGLFYVASSTKENELRLQEDKKILGQILSFASIPNPIVLKFSNNIDTILKRTKDIDKIIENMKSDYSIKNEMNVVEKYYRETQDSKAREGEIFLTMVFGAIVLYLICIIFIVKKLS